jgi:hypothetical protein
METPPLSWPKRKANTLGSRRNITINEEGMTVERKMAPVKSLGQQFT